MPNTDGPEIAQKIDGHIKPGKWALGLAIYFPFSQILAILGSENPGFESHFLIIFVAQGLAGALLGALMAFGARHVVKAIRC